MGITQSFQLTAEDAWVIRNLLGALDAEVSQDIVTMLIAVLWFDAQVTIHITLPEEG